MARADGFVAKFGRRRDISTISVRFFDENSIVYFERLLDDRRSLDDTFIVSARMRDVEKTLKNLDRAHKIRVRRRFADPRSTRHGLQTTSKIHRKIEDKFEGKNDRKTDRKWRPRTLQIRRLGRPVGHVGRPAGHVGRQVGHVGRPLGHVGRQVEHVGPKLGAKWAMLGPI